jgi:hypothetical protein
MRNERSTFWLGETSEAATAGSDGTAALAACSACAGDYEDPDYTAWTPDEADGAGSDDALDTGTEEFPAEK